MMLCWDAIELIHLPEEGGMHIIFLIWNWRFTCRNESNKATLYMHKRGLTGLSSRKATQSQELSYNHPPRNKTVLLNCHFLVLLRWAILSLNNYLSCCIIPTPSLSLDLTTGSPPKSIIKLMASPIYPSWFSNIIHNGIAFQNSKGEFRYAVSINANRSRVAIAICTCWNIFVSLRHQSQEELCVWQ